MCRHIRVSIRLTMGRVASVGTNGHAIPGRRARGIRTEMACAGGQTVESGGGGVLRTKWAGMGREQGRMEEERRTSRAEGRRWNMEKESGRETAGDFAHLLHQLKNN